MVAIAAIALAPSEGQHRERIEKAAIACVEKKISSSLGAVGGSALSPISSIAFNVELVQQKIRERLEQENRIEVENRVFWSQGRIYNQLHPMIELTYARRSRRCLGRSGGRQWLFGLG